jgi:hypothetical protein
MSYLLFNIGCIECGVSSGVVGVFTDKIKADKLASICDEHHHWREGGQNSYEVFELPSTLDEVAKEYLIEDKK